MRKAFMLLLAAVLYAAPAVAQSQALTRSTLAEDADVQRRVKFLADKVALEVMAETPETCCGSTAEASRAQHDVRTRVAGLVIRDPQSVAYRIALAVLTNYSLTQASADADIQKRRLRTSGITMQRR